MIWRRGFIAEVDVDWDQWENFRIVYVHTKVGILSFEWTWPEFGIGFRWRCVYPGCFYLTLPFVCFGWSNG